MLIRAGCIGRHRKVDLSLVLPAVLDAVEDSALDPDSITVTLDWVQYKHNFRPPVAARRFSGDRDDLAHCELAIDIRRAADTNLEADLRAALAGNSVAERVYLEDAVRPSQSVIWSFNRSYWEHLSAWESTFKNDYAAALPGGVSDGTNPDFWRHQSGAFVDVLDGLAERGVLPDEIYVMELGVGSGQQALVWLDTFRDLCSERGNAYYDRLQYLMTDYSRDVLRVARVAVAEHGDRVSAINLDATDPLEALMFLRYKVLFIHSCNLYDNLPTDEAIRRGDDHYEVKIRAYIERARAVEICETHGVDPDALVPTIERLLRVGPDAMDDEKTAIKWWAEIWDAVRLEESYEAIPDLSSVVLAPGVGVTLGDVVAGLADHERVHLSTIALQSFANTLRLLHPQGIFLVQDIFIRDLAQYETFRGPGKMDGSIVNWVNGAFFRDVGAHLGFNVALEPFAYREKSNTVVLTTTPKD